MTYTLIRNGTLLDGRGNLPVENGAVLVEDKKIIGVGRASEIILPETSYATVDAEGGFILPGFIDTHVHLMLEGVDLQNRLSAPFSKRFYQAIPRMQRTLAAGVTTVRDAGGADLGLKQSVEDGLVPGPRMQISIAVLTTTGGHADGWMPSGFDFPFFPSYPGNPDGLCDGVEGVRRKVREVLRAGAEVLKVCATGGVLSPTDHPTFTQFSLNELKVIVEEGRFRNGVRVMAHAQGAEGIKNSVRAGIHSIEHGIFLDEEAIELMLENGTFLVPTLLAPLAVLEVAEASGEMPEWGVKKSREVLEIHRENVAKAYQAGVKIAMGTDAGVMPHGTNLRELGLLCDIGMTPMEVIQASTKVAAECLGWESEVGTLEVGKYADLLITKTDPLASIRSLEDPANIPWVMKGGEIIKNL
jgi:imidazolonepropionase-like amidohydrolase